jgi:hypothetical protein
MISIEKLKENHFTPTGDRVTYSRKISACIFLEYDTQDGFLTIIRLLFKEKHNKDRVKIIFPHKIDTVAKLKTLTDLFSGTFT